MHMALSTIWQHLKVVRVIVFWACCISACIEFAVFHALMLTHGGVLLFEPNLLILTVETVIFGALAVAVIVKAIREVKRCIEKRHLSS